MKNMMLKILLVTLCLSFSSCKQKGENQNAPKKETSVKGEKNELSSEDEKELATRIKDCRSDWKHLAEKSDRKEEALVAMGIVGRECLKIEKIISLKAILISYESEKNDENVDWIEVSKTIIKMESI